MRLRPWTLVAAAASLTLAGAGLAEGTGAASAAPAYAPAATAKIHPGTMMYTAGAQCTANFVYTDSAGATYVGYAAHCAGKGSSTDTNGCDTASVPLGTKVDFTNDGNLASEGTVVGHGTLVYSSWITEHRLGTTDANTCAYNDLALVQVDRADVAKVNPSVPFWGGPTGIDTDGTKAGDRVWTYGNSSLRGGLAPLSPHTGVSLGDDAADGGWSHPLYAVSPGIPGDSGSGFMSAGGKAVGVLSLVEQVPPGRVTTYGLIAEVVGSGPRLVGNVMSTEGGGVPWWRVVRADGSLPPSHDDEARQAYLAEGTPLRPNGAVDLRAAVWLPPEPPDPA